MHDGWRVTVLHVEALRSDASSALTKAEVCFVVWLKTGFG
jgi:hypothetical protein